MRRKFTGESLAEVVRLYSAGHSAEQIAERFGTIPVTVLRTLRREGVTIRRGGQRETFTSAQVIDLVARYRSGQSQESIAKDLGCSQPRISRTLRTLGIRTGRSHLQGTRHPRWKGGQLVMRGYRYVSMPAGHPFEAMRQAQGYVAEHRLVMAESLGRVLASSETVHHINGDGLDNRLENLQLRHGRHGKGKVLVCCACGSHDIAEVPLR